MLVFPQLSSGASAQYPILKQLSQRSVQSAMEDGSVITMADQAANNEAWRVAYRGITDQEAGALRSFYESTLGNLVGFLFFDPTANLIRWSEDFSQPSWQANGIAFDSGVTDPFGTTCASRARNAASIDQTIIQSTQMPGSVQACFSVYLRAAGPIEVPLARLAGNEALRVTAAVTSAWQRFYLSGTLPSNDSNSAFAITAPAGCSLEIFGPQLDVQVSPSAYTKSYGQSGVFSNARFDMSKLDITATGHNRNDCVVKIRCNRPAG